MSNLIINCICLHCEANLHTCLEGEIGRPVNYCNTYLLFVDIWCLAFKATTFAVKCWSPQSLIVTPFLYPAVSFCCYRNTLCLSVGLSVCISVTLVIFAYTVQYIEICCGPHNRVMSLVFEAKFNRIRGFSPNDRVKWGTSCQKWHFDQYAAIA